MQILGIHAVCQFQKKYLIFLHPTIKSIQTDPQISKSQRNGVGMPAISFSIRIVTDPSFTVITKTGVVFLILRLPISCCQRNQELQILKVKVPQMRFLRMFPVIPTGNAALI